MPEQAFEPLHLYSWCGHCKKLEPEFEKAAGELKDEGITLAKVDATEEQNKEISSKFGVSGFPTLKVFRGSEENPTEWEGPRDAEGIVSYAKRQFGPAVTKISTEEEAKKATTPSADLSVVGVFPDGDDSKAAKAFKEVAESLRNDATFVYTTSAKLVKDAGGKQAVLVYRDFDDNMVKFDGKFEKVCSCRRLLSL
jgi:protein disulfide-isomerase-like protein